MNKVIYEYYYIVGRSDFERCYILKVDKETEKMYYGVAFEENVTSTKGARFSLKKSYLDMVHKIIDRKYGLVYRIQIEADDKYEAEHKAREIIYNYMLFIAKRFMNHKED